MKNFSLFFILLFVAFFSIATIAQPWFSQPAPGLPNSLDPQVLLFPVDDSICWGICLSTNHFLKTTTGGSNWTVSTVTNSSGLQGQGMSALDANTAWIAMRDASLATSGGIFKTTDGGNTWTKQTTAFQGSGGVPRVIHFFDANNGLCVGDPRNGEFEIYTTVNGGNNWNLVDGANIPNPVSGELGTAQFSAQGIGNHFWFQTNADAIYKTTDRGYTWVVTRNIMNINGRVPFAFKDTLNGLACTFVGGNKISRTTDGGSTWTPIIPLDSALSNLSTFFIAYAKGTPGAYVITSHNNYNGVNQAVPGSAYTLDDGDHWTYLNNKKLGPARFSDWNTGWAGGINDTIWKWDSDILPVELSSFTANTIGSNVELKWQTATETNNQGFEIYRNGNKIAFVEGKGTTTENQDYSFVDKNLQSGIYNYRLNQIDFDGTQEVVGELTINLTLPEQFALEQNYPNPFNPSTTISWQSPVGSWQTLKIYDLLGREVVTLVDEYKPAGSYEVEFDARGLSSGVYLYTLQAGSFTNTKKLILMK
jgi:photosystem II stability/assembly factor-like uncharacterized protein